jgi:hypothetical protein
MFLVLKDVSGGNAEPRWSVVTHEMLETLEEATSLSVHVAVNERVTTKVVKYINDCYYAGSDTEENLANLFDAMSDLAEEKGMTRVK